MGHPVFIHIQNLRTKPSAAGHSKSHVEHMNRKLHIYNSDKIKGKFLRIYFCKYGEVQSVNADHQNEQVWVKFRECSGLTAAFGDGDVRETSRHLLKDVVVECRVLLADDGEQV